MAEEMQSTPTESTGGETTAGGEATWSYAEGVAGSGDAPEYFKADKYKTLADQAKAYNELESKFGAFSGSPSEYTLNKDIGIDSADPLYNKFAEIGKKYNMNNEMFNEVMTMYTENQAEQQAAYIEQQKAELGENGQTRLNNLNDWVKANVPTELQEMVVNWTQSAKDVEALEALIGMTKGQQMASPNHVNNTPAYTEEGLLALQIEEDAYGRRKLSSDPAHKKKYEAYANELLKLQNS